MARPLRIEFPGAVYHVTSRGNARLPILEDNQDRRRFLSVLDEAVKRFNWLCHAYCLMDNHYHLLVETIDGNLSVGMRRVNGVSTLTPITVGIIGLRPLNPPLFFAQSAPRLHSRACVRLTFCTQCLFLSACAQPSVQNLRVDSPAVLRDRPIGQFYSCPIPLSCRDVLNLEQN